ncbi:hypothetical protein [Streptomyces sp. NBC_01190]|uniref:hypothetical protein n=1 Tax=Streptomyces sp. NBC_01190 TaxID=2903767 RepID=UPI0038708E9B|nr:hypothetical protein OG519_16300 [Streptomyces sp. NBC_01190]
MVAYIIAANTAAPDSHITKRVVLSAVVIVISVVMDLLLKLVSTNSGGASPLNKEDAVLWADLTVSAVISFSVFAAGSVKSATFNQGQLLALVGVVVFSFAVIPTYVRWYGLDATGTPHLWRGIIIPNVLGCLTVGVAINYGVNFAG